MADSSLQRPDRVPPVLASTKRAPRFGVSRQCRLRRSNSAVSHLVQKFTLTGPILEVSFVNKTTSNTVYAYVSGQGINNNNAIFLLESDEHTLYFPTSPSRTGQSLQANCAIPLSASGSTVNITIPQIAGGGVWFSINSPLTFLLNPGPALVEPSVTNYSDPNINVRWGFCEFTYNSSQLYATISYVDFVSSPIALRLTDKSGAVQTVTSMRSSTTSSPTLGQLLKRNDDHNQR